MSRNFRLGVFFVATLLLLGSGVFFIGSRSFLLKSTYRVRAEFDNVAGLVPGADVRVGGVHQGVVRRINLPAKPQGKVAVVIDLDTGTRNVVKKDSVAAIKAEGLLGAKYVEISFGSDGAGGLKDGDILGTETPVDVADLIKTAGEILDSTKNTVQNVQSITGKVDQGVGTAGAVINDQRLYQQAREAVDEARQGTTAFHENMEALKHNFFLRGFFHRRGYEDSSELGKHDVAQLPQAAIAKKFVYSQKEIFDRPDSAKLKNPKNLKEAGSFLEANRFGLAVVVDHTGKAGDAEKNRLLSQARTMVVRDFLAKNFKLDDTRLKTFGAGEAREGAGQGSLEILVYPVGTKAMPARISSERQSPKPSGD